MLNIAIFISSRGSNMKKILENIKNGYLNHIRVSTIVSDNPKALGLEVAKSYNIPIHVIDIDKKYKYSIGKNKELELSQHLKSIGVNIICLAGFMRLIKYSLLKDYKNKIINIHPSLLPKYTGLNTHQRAIENKEKYSGATVHLVDSGMDTGKILKQVSVKIDLNDTAETLASKIIKQEHLLYSEVLKDISDKKIIL